MLIYTLQEKVPVYSGTVVTFIVHKVFAVLEDSPKIGLIVSESDSEKRRNHPDERRCEIYS